MTSRTRSVRDKNNKRRQNQVNLVSARSRSNSEVHKLSRLSAANSYSEIRKKRSRNRKLTIALSILLSSILVAGMAGGVAYAVLNGNLSTDLQGNKADFSSTMWTDTFVEPEQPEDPFWMLLLGTDAREEEGDVGRTDTIILVRVDQVNQTAAMVSIPRDLYVDIPGYGRDKVNAAYSVGEQEETGGGVPLTIKTISELAGIDISYFAQVSFDGIEQLVDGLGGVTVDVPVDIIGYYDTHRIDIYAGVQELDGETALAFVRSREYTNGDYQRQANQRTFLQAVAKQVLAANPAEIASTVTTVTEMTYTNLDIAKIVKIAQGMRGLQESSIHTYTVPSAPADMPGGSYLLTKEDEWQDLIQALDSGEYPPPQEGDEMYNNVAVPDSYVAGSTTQSVDPNLQAADYTVDVRNGCGIEGCATSILDKLLLAGYARGAEPVNTDAYIYPNTYIIYKDESYRAAANDIKTRIGYGKVVAAEGRYEFTGDILVIVGDDYSG